MRDFFDICAIPRPFVVNGRKRAIVLLACCSLVAGVAAQPIPDTLQALRMGTEPFVRAKAVAVDPFGNVYVVDAGRGVVLKLDEVGAVVGALGGPGAPEGRFDDPSDVDPTNGLTIAVADAGNGRIQRFSRAFAFLASIPVQRGQTGDVSTPARTTYRRRDDDLDEGATGTPIAVVVSAERETFAIDADRHLVLKWDDHARFQRSIGAFDAGAGALDDPVALAIGPQSSLYVADRGRRGVVVFDTFGAFERTIGSGRLGGIRNVAASAEALWVVTGERVLVYSFQGRFQHAFVFPIDAPLVDVAVAGGSLLVLTDRWLYRALLP